MRKTLTLLAAASAAAILGAPATQATPLARAGLDVGAEPAHSVRICDDDGDCWWSNRPNRGGYGDEGHGWRHGWRDRDDYYGRGERWRERDWDNDRDRYERHGGYRDRDDWGRSGEREHYGRDVDRDRDHDRDRGAREESREHAMKERGGAHAPGAQANPETKKD